MGLLLTTRQQAVEKCDCFVEVDVDIEEETASFVRFNDPTHPTSRAIELRPEGHAIADADARLLLSSVTGEISTSLSPAKNILGAGKFGVSEWLPHLSTGAMADLVKPLATPPAKKSEAKFCTTVLISTNAGADLCSSTMMLSTVCILAGAPIGDTQNMPSL